MKCRDIIHELQRAGWHLKRHGKRHDLYVNPTNAEKESIMWHVEMKESLCMLIRKELGLK